MKSFTTENNKQQILAMVLAFSLILSLISGVVPASAATTGHTDCVTITVKDASGVVDGASIEYVVKDDQGNVKKQDTITTDSDGVAEILASDDYEVGLKLTANITKNGYKMESIVESSISNAYANELVTIKKIISGVSFHPQSLKYNGNFQEVVTVEGALSSECYYKESGEDTWHLGLPKLQNVGSKTYSLKVVRSGYADYEQDNLVASITDGDNNTVYSASLKSDIIYTGAPQNLLRGSVQGLESGDRLYYSLNNGTWIQGTPVATNPQVYTVRLKVVRENYLDVEVPLNPNTVEIKKAELPINFVNSFGTTKRVDFNESNPDANIYDFKAVCNKSGYENITYTIENGDPQDSTNVSQYAEWIKEQVPDPSDMSGQTFIEQNTTKLKIKRGGCTIKVVATVAGDSQYADTSIACLLTVSATGDIFFENDVITYECDSSATVTNQSVKNAYSNDKGVLTYSAEICNSSQSIARAGLKIEADTGKITLENRDALMSYLDDSTGNMQLKVTVQKEEYKIGNNVEFTAANASYNIIILYEEFPENGYILKDPEGNVLTDPNGKNGWYNTPVIVVPIDGYLIRKDAENENTASTELIFDNQGIEERKIRLTNQQTNAITKSKSIGVDKLDSISPDANSFTIDYSEPVASNIFKFYKDSVEITFTGYDQTSGIDYFSWNYVRSDVASKSNLNNISGTVLATQDSTDSTKYVAKLTLPKEQAVQMMGHIVVTATDKAGNTSEKMDENGNVFVIDNISPTVKARYQLKNSAGSHQVVGTKHYFSGPIEYTLDVTEANFYAEDIKVSVKKNGEYGQVKQLVWKKTINQDEHEATFMLSEDGSYEVAITYSDRSSNEMVEYKSETIIIDTVAPAMTISYSTPNKRANGLSYYNYAPTIMLNIEESNFYSSDVVVKGTKNGSVVQFPVTWKEIDKSHHIGTIAIPTSLNHDSDGRYIFTFDYTDKSNNKMKTQATETLVIDTIGPAISVTYGSTNQVQTLDGITYYEGDIPATISIDEVNFSVSDVYVEVTKDGVKYPVNVSWLERGLNTHIGSFSMSTDGDYYVSVSCVDEANNQTTQYKSQQMTIDTEIVEPIITINGEEADGKAYKGDVVPTVTFEDKNFQDYEIILTCTNFSDKNIDVTDKFIDGHVSINGQGGTGTFDVFKKIQDNDGIYTLTATITDKAGHEIEKAITFTVNRFGSVYEYSDYLVSLIADGGAYVQNINNDLIITEYNADKLVQNSLNIEISKDGKPLEGAVYDVTPTINDNVGIGNRGWYQYMYTLSKDNFMSDGIYKISVSSADKTGNTPENTNYEDKEILFRVDSTAPEINSITGLEKQIVNATSLDVTYIVYDTIGLDCIDVYIDGEIIESIVDFTDDFNNYTGNFTLEESSASRDVRFVVTDKAGNVTDTASPDFDSAFLFNDKITVSTNMFVRWFANKIAFFGTIMGVIAVTGIISSFVYLRRRKSDNGIG